MSANDDTLARLTFNAAAMRDYIGDDAQGVRLRIERSEVAFRPAKSLRGVDVIAIERRPRGTTVDIGRGMLPRRLMQRLFKAGLTENQPYFVVGPVARGWFGIEHVPDQQAPPRQPLMVVSDFDMPPSTIDLTLWQRFMRLVTAGRTIPDETWKPVAEMVRSAEQVVTRKGRRTQEKDAAERLIGGIARNAQKLLYWSERQPEYAAEVTGLMTRLGIEMETEAATETVAEEEPPEEPAEDVPEAPEVQEAAPPRRTRRRKSRGFSPTEPATVEREPWIVDVEVEEVVITVGNDGVAEVHEAEGQEAQGHEVTGEEVVQGANDDEVQADDPVSQLSVTEEIAAIEAEFFEGEGTDDATPPDTEADQPEVPEDIAARNELDEVILAAWERHEMVQPDISTERLIMMVQDDTGADGPRQVEAMIRAGWPLPDDLKNID